MVQLGSQCYDPNRKLGLIIKSFLHIYPISEWSPVCVVFLGLLLRDYIILNSYFHLVILVHRIIIWAMQNFFLTSFPFIFLISRVTQPETSRGNKVQLHWKQFNRADSPSIVRCHHIGAKCSKVQVHLNILQHITHWTGLIAHDSSLSNHLREHSGSCSVLIL